MLAALRSQRCLAAVVLAISCALAACSSTSASRPASFCSLESRDLHERLARIQKLVAENGTGLRELPDGFVLRFHADPRVTKDLEDLVVRERECCAEFSWRLDHGAEDRVLLLTLHGAAEGRDYLLARIREAKVLPSF
jgi:hypothetical protein